MASLKIDKYTRKILIIFICCSIGIIFAWMLIYSGQAREKHNLKGEINQFDQNFIKLRDLILEHNTIRGGLLNLKDKYLSLRNKFPGHAQDIIKELSKFAKDKRIIISSISPKFEGPLKQPSGGDFKLGVATFWLVKFNIRASGNFISIGDFLESLKVDFPYLVSVENIDLTKSANTTSGVQLNLVLNAYLLN